MTEDDFTPSLILSFLSGNRHRWVRHRVCPECHCPHIYEERKFNPHDEGYVNAEFVGGRIIQPIDHIIAKITLEDTFTVIDIDGMEINFEVTFGSTPTINGKRLNVDWDDEITSGLREGHRIELDFLRNNETSQSKYTVEGIILKCDHCELIQPKNQPVLSHEFWQAMVENGAPEFYLRPFDNIIAEYEESNISYTNLFRNYDAHPWECQIDYEPEHVLRDFMHILYDQVRTKAMEIENEKRRALDEAFSKWRMDLPHQVNKWRQTLGLDSLDLHLINLYLFEEESDFYLNQEDRKELLKECGQ